MLNINGLAEPSYSTSESWRPNKGITFGTFDLLHSGHITMLEQCRSQCDYLIVGLQSDPTIDRPDTKNRPVQSLFERYAQLSSSRFVDQIIPYDTEEDLANMLSILDLRKRFLGEEYKDQFIFARDVCKLRNIELVYIERKHNYSSTNLRGRVYAKELSKRSNNPS
jgi:glycerol-3-phosphate cytidylyltransferase